MRLGPVPMYYFNDREAAISQSGASARTTHGAKECVDAIRLFAAMLWLALSGEGKDAILYGHGMTDLCSERLRSIARGDYRSRDVGLIRSNGYVVDSLEGGPPVLRADGAFEDAILCAANLGDDADTTAPFAVNWPGRPTGIPAFRGTGWSGSHSLSRSGPWQSACMLPGAVNRSPTFARMRSSRVWSTARACSVPSCCLSVATIIRDTSTGICCSNAGKCNSSFHLLRGIDENVMVSLVGLLRSHGRRAYRLGVVPCRRQTTMDSCRRYDVRDSKFP